MGHKFYGEILSGLYGIFRHQKSEWITERTEQSINQLTKLGGIIVTHIRTFFLRGLLPYSYWYYICMFRFVEFLDTFMLVGNPNDSWRHQSFFAVKMKPQIFIQIHGVAA